MVNRLNWQCCLAGSSKTASKILIFSIAMDADYSIVLISIETYNGPQFIGHTKMFLRSVKYAAKSKMVTNEEANFVNKYAICHFVCYVRIFFTLLYTGKQIRVQPGQK